MWILWFCASIIYFATSANAKAFFCSNGLSINASQFCNNVQDCDGSDEITSNTSSCSTCDLYITSCTTSSHNKTCLLHRDYICNGTVTCQGLTPCDVGCPSHYKCQNSNRCFLRSTVCNGFACDGCPEDDDWKNGIGFKCARKGRICRLPQQLLWDSVQDCDDGSDLCYIANDGRQDGRDIRNNSGVTFNDKTCTRCFDNNIIIPRRRVCDGIVDCPDLSDECLCENQVSNICNHVTSRTAISSHSCSPGQVSCGTGNTTKFINQTSICDGIADCSDNLDEKYGFCKGTLPCSKGLLSEAGHTCRCHLDPCPRPPYIYPKPVYNGILCNGVEDCKLPKYVKWHFPPGFPEDECEAQCPTGLFNCTKNASGSSGGPAVGMNSCLINIPHGNRTIAVLIPITYTKICDGIIDCTGDGWDESNCPDRFRCKSGKYMSILKTKVCDGRKDCDNGTDEHRSICPKRFYCSSLHGQMVSVSSQVVCDFVVNCDKAEDELNCTGIDGRFYCKNKKPLYVHKNQIMDGHRDCSDWSDECSKQFNTGANILSSRYDLIANPILRAIVWIMALLAFFGNLVVIIGESRTLKTILSEDRGAAMRTNHMLVLNLAVADFFMAIYLLMLGIAGGVYSGSYCAQSLSWLTSRSCIVMGVLVVLSSETSVMTMFLLTATRLFAVYNPMSALHKPSFRSVLLMVTFTWAISLTLALIPLSSFTQSSFVEKVLIENNPYFSNVVVHFDAAKNFTTKLLTYSQQLSSQPDAVLQQVSAMTSWNELDQFLSTNYPQRNLLNISNQFGYYSANSVCIPNLFVTTKDWVWKYSLSISIINFMVFMFVSATYTAIIIKATKSSNKLQKSGGKTTALQRKVVRLIVTDFCCWIPLSIMVFVNFSGVKIDSVSYAVAAIVLLPINSALNPILYSNFVDKITEKCRKKVEEFRTSSTKSGQVAHSTHETTSKGRNTSQL